MREHVHFLTEDMGKHTCTIAETDLCDPVFLGKRVEALLQILALFHHESVVVSVAGEGEKGKRESDLRVSLKSVLR